MADTYVIDITKLKKYKNDFNDERKKFRDKAYERFKSSYINTCNDSIINEMYLKLKSKYSKINSAYKNIYNWWDSYCDNIEALEKTLASDSKATNISSITVRNYVINQLPKLKDYKINDVEIKFARGMEKLNSAFINGFAPSAGVLSLIKKEDFKNVNAQDKRVDKIFSKVSNLVDDTSGWIKSEAIPWAKQAAEKVVNLYIKTAATVATVVTSLVEGIFQFGEAIVDTLAVISGAIATIPNLIIDGVQAVYGKITGNEWESYTKETWNEVMAFVKPSHVTTWFDDYYKNNFIGKWTSQNSFYFDQIRSVGNGIGYIAGVVVLTIATAGIGTAVAGGTASVSAAASATSATNMAITSGIVGVGKGTEKAWQEGATLATGLGSGILSGIWEGIQFYVGGKIGNLNFLQNSGSGTKFINSLGRVILDGVDGGVEGFIQPLISSIYKEGYYNKEGQFIKFDSEDSFIKRIKENFDDNGGWNYVMTEAVTGSAFSLLGEGFDLGKHFSNDNSIKNLFNIEKEIDELPNFSNFDAEKAMNESYELVELFNTEEFKKWKYVTSEGYAGILRKDFEDAEIRYKELSEQLNEYSKFQSQLESLDINKLSHKNISKIIAKLDNYNLPIFLDRIRKMNNAGNPVTFTMASDAGIYFNDSKLYLYSKLEEKIKVTTDIVEINNLKKIKKDYSCSPADYESIDLLNSLSSYLEQDELDIAINLINSSKNIESQLSPLEKLVIKSYTATGGPAVSTFTRNKKFYFHGKKVGFDSIEEANDYISRSLAREQDKKFISTDKIKNINDYISIIDSIIEKSEPLNDDLMVYRGMQAGVYFNGNHISNLSVGQRFNDKAFASCTINNEFLSRNKDDYDIMLRVLLPSGTKCKFIESFSGVHSYNQKELLLPRNSEFVIKSLPTLDKNTGKLILDVELLPQ